MKMMPLPDAAGADVFSVFDSDRGASMKSWIRAAVAALVLCVLSLPAQAQYNEFIGFGDSSLDSGWFAGSLTNQCGAVAAPCNTGNDGRDERIGNAVER